MHRCYKPLAVALMAAALFMTVDRAQAADDQVSSTINLINGMSINGTIEGISEAGLEITVGRSKRTYPWYALSPGTRFKYDQSYRMNIDGYLSGAPASSLTNAPDPEYDPMHPPAVSSENVEAVSATRTINYGAINLAPPVAPASLPALSVLSVESRAFYAVQFGPANNDVAYFGFAPDEPGNLMILNAREGRVANETAVPRKTGEDTYLVFNRQTYGADFDGIQAEQNIQWMVRSDKPTLRYINAEVNLARGTQRAKFVLQGDPSGFKQATESLTPRPLLVEPSMSFTVTIEDEKPYLVGRVRMGRLSLLPRGGMDLKVEVDVQDASGKSVSSQSLAFDADAGPAGYPLRMDIGTLIPGQQYKVKASMSLGALLGDVAHEMFFIMPDAAKL